MARVLKKFLKYTGMVFLALLLLVILVPLLVPLPQIPNLSSAEKLTDPDSQFITLSNLRIHYKEAGKGQTSFILLHGFGASTYSWREVMQPLALLGRVLAYDRPAFGLTERPTAWEGLNPYGTEANAKLVIDLMDAKGIQKAILVGNSAGGTVAVATALKYPERVQALVLVDAAIYGGGMSLPSWLKPVLRLPQATWFGQLFVRQIQDWGIDVLLRAWADPTLITDEIKANYRKPLQMPNWDRALWELTLSNEPLNLSARLPELKLPVLVVTGDSDRIVPTESSIRLAGEIPGAKLVVFSRCGHVPQEECPDQFMTAINNFFPNPK